MNTTMIDVTRVSSPSEIMGIRDLQALNLKQNITAEEAIDQGFLTATYTINYLQEMNAASPSIIAKDGNKVVGQLCVAKEYRGQDLVQKLYGYFRDCLSKEFTYLVTDIAQANTRSLKAHQKRGFQVINELMYGGVKWDIVLWDWNTTVSL
jgi:hypothetical protein